MKKLIIFGLMCFSLTSGYAQSYFRYIFDEKHYFEVCPNRVVIRVDERATENAIESSLRRNISLQEFEILEMGRSDYRMVRFRDTNRSAITQLVNQRISDDAILHVGYVVIDETGIETSALTNELNIKLKDEKQNPF